MLNTLRFLTHVNVTRSDSFGDHLWMVKLSVEEPDALMCARPDLWEPWVSNHPGPPGLQRRSVVANLHRCLFVNQTSAPKPTSELVSACPTEASWE